MERAPPCSSIDQGIRNISVSLLTSAAMIADEEPSDAHLSRTRKDGIMRVAMFEHTQPCEVAEPFV